MSESIRNVAIIAHVDHGKTTLVDRLLLQSGTLGDRPRDVERMMDSNAIERERGITILAKNTALRWGGHRINVVDTPGHADFGGEVERVLSMVDAVLLLVDAVDGPMPQTRFVTQKAFSHGLQPIVVINKIDRDGARPDWVLGQTFDLFDQLGANDTQLDFTTVYTSALQGTATLDLRQPGEDMTPLFQTIVDQVPAPKVDEAGPFRMRVSLLDWSSYVGAIGIGRIDRGRIRPNTPITLVGPDGRERAGRILQVLGFSGLERTEVSEAAAGDIVAITGVERLGVSDTLCDPSAVEALPALTVDEPTVSMTFQVNTSPFSGRDGKFLTSRQIGERLDRELVYNVALRVEGTERAEQFKVSGRGELHLSILLENMRREGYELAVSRPEVIRRVIDGVMSEPWEQLTVDIESDHQGEIMGALGERRGELTGMQPDGRGRVRLDYRIPARGLIGFQTEFLMLTSGSGLMHHVFDSYQPALAGEIGRRKNGALISSATGTALAYALFNLQERGRMLIGPGDDVYEGQVVGIHSRANDLVVNPLKGKQLTNVRASGKDDNIMLTPAMRLTLEQALEFIEADELVEITPKFIRIRKRFLLEHERRTASRKAG